ncbi:MULTISPECIES: hypothetical protein [unclassified Psychrobacter]|nr:MULTISPECIES: hypothetical protein [unclassified Psychrobacter]
MPNSVENLIGQNIDFDIGALKVAGVTDDPKLNCTNAMAKYLLLITG